MTVKNTFAFKWQKRADMSSTNHVIYRLGCGIVCLTDVEIKRADSEELAPNYEISSFNYETDKLNYEIILERPKALKRRETSLGLGCLPSFI